MIERVQPKRDHAVELEIDLAATETFLRLLDPRAERWTFLTFDDDRERKDQRLNVPLHGTLSEHAERLCELNRKGAGVFAVMGETDLRGCATQNIIRVRALSLDLDGKPLEPVLAGDLLPHIVVESSSGKYHAYWRVAGATYDANNEATKVELKEFADLQRGIAKAYDGDPAVAILTHLARLPGFFHRKREPFQVRIHADGHSAHDSYSWDQICAAFPPQKKPHRAPGSAITLPAGAPLVAAEAFIQHCHSLGDIPLLRHYRGAFYRWVQTHWREMAVESVERALYIFLKPVMVQKKNGYESFNPTRNKIGEIVHALQRGMMIDDRVENPGWLGLQNEGRSAENLVAVRNGILNLETRELLPHDPNFLTMNCLPLDYDPEAPKPERWLKFLLELWPEKIIENAKGKQVDVNAQAENCLQEIFGYLITTDTSQQKIFLLVGPKRGGKGTIISILVQLLGRENCVFQQLKSLAGEFGRWPLIDKKLSVVADARLGPKTDTHAVAEHLLSISGGDEQTINRKLQSFWTGALGVRFMITTNELPAIADASGTLASRFVFLPMTESFYGREQLNLKNKLRPELAGILNWALDGLDRLRRRGYFKMPDTSHDALKQLEELGSPVSAFVRDWCEVGEQYRIKIQELYGAYCCWSKEAGHVKPLPQGYFGRALSTVIPKLDRTQASSLKRQYIGVRLSAEGDAHYEELRNQASDLRRR
jgi:putative DNA primase/helicase